MNITQTYQTDNDVESTPAAPSAKQLLRHILPLFRQYRLRLFAGFAALIVVDFLQLSIPRILKRGVDSLAAESATREILLRYGLYIILIAMGVVVLRFIWRYMIIGFSRYLERAIRNRIFAHIVKMDTAFFEKRTTGDIMAHASNDLNAVQMACGMGMVAAVDALVMTVAAIAFMSFIHVKLTLLALLPMPFLAIFTRILSGRMHRRFTTVQEQFSLLTEFSRSTLVSVKLIKAYTMEKFQTREFDKLGRKYVKSNLGVARIQGLMFPIATLVGNMGMLLILFFGGRLVIIGEISMGDFVAFITYLYMLIWPMMAIGWVTNLVQRGITSLTRIDSLLKERSLLPYAGEEVEKQEQITFELKNLNFTYPSSASPVLKDFSLTIGPGIHGMTGRTGSGKSTICKILARLYPVKDDSLFFNGLDVNTLAVESICANIGYVAQEPTLFSNSIAANIKLGKPEAVDEKMEEAARLAAIHEDIMAFPDGYETIIGERGVKLSGGQRQRLALARALLIDRPVLIIDDGLSAVDVETEHQIFAGLKEHLQGKTVLIVSNRLKLLTMTDHIIVLENGEISHDGRHEQLLEQSRFYRSMFAKQMRESEQLDYK
ncbi:MAG: ABC transporter ATP-binding protein [Desulfocapsaceae bacterium]|nr:ABC transporter ATP-binding protein [Desulfocapsaceae bacterium]